jgi:uncharacterized membrane protein YphA (DoxX/SURF4 family)
MTSQSHGGIVRIGRLFYAAGITAIGAQTLVNGDFVSVIIPALPAWVPGHALWVYLCAFGLIFCGAAILVGIRARPAALVLGSALLVCLVLVHLPEHFAGSDRSAASWVLPFKVLTLAGGAFVSAVSLRDGPQGAADRRMVAFGCVALGATCVDFGIDHFIYADFVATLVPAWISGHMFWTYFCGVALIAAGVGMILRIKARLASGLLGAMIFVWLLVLHIPRAIADPVSGHGNEPTSVCEALSFSGIALMLSRMLPGWDAPR